MKRLFLFAVVAFAVALAPASSLAAPPETTDGFVCPVITTESVLNSPNAQAIGGGDYSIIGPNVTVPTHATNGNGAGTPGGPHSSPGDSDYTAIWAG